MTTAISIKQGQTFDKSFTTALGPGTWHCSAIIKSTTGVTIGSLTTNLSLLSVPDSLGNTHTGALSASSIDTASWPVGNWLFDVKFYDESVPPVVDYEGPYVVQVTMPTTP